MTPGASASGASAASIVLATLINCSSSTLLRFVNNSLFSNNLMAKNRETALRIRMMITSTRSTLAIAKPSTLTDDTFTHMVKR
ncbi:MAG: hypothetical protein BWX70_02334 [Verrucomicrobia bacterium ADurb.Bin070]|nr:MAG: hypothetical protein BWX70_02334 [Verrucomicrobia bacterium ADurb.Bin070]